jgi:hypothetical protein
VDLVDLVLLGVGKMDGWQGGEGRGGDEGICEDVWVM